MIDNLLYLLGYLYYLIIFVSPLVIASMIMSKLIDNHIEKKEKKQNALDTQKRIQKIKMNELFKMIEEEYKWKWTR